MTIRDPEAGREAGQTASPAKREPIVTLGFKVPRSFRQHFKRMAVDADISNVELLKRALDSYEQTQQQP